MGKGRNILRSCRKVCFVRILLIIQIRLLPFSKFFWVYRVEIFYRTRNCNVFYRTSVTSRKFPLKYVSGVFFSSIKHDMIKLKENYVSFIYDFSIFPPTIFDLPITWSLIFFSLNLFDVILIPFKYFKVTTNSI